MTREILSRGKCFNTGEWVEGSLFILKHYQTDIKHYYIIPTNTICLFCDLFFLAREVDPSTAGQYTGLCDKNGKKIFEGDICHVGHLLYMVEFNYSQWKFSILSDKVYCYPAFNSHCGERCIIIGNIHDNPELLEGEG